MLALAMEFPRFVLSEFRRTQPSEQHLLAVPHSNFGAKKTADRVPIGGALQAQRVANLGRHPGGSGSQVDVLYSTTAWAFYTPGPRWGQGSYSGLTGGAQIEIPFGEGGSGYNPSMGAPQWVWILVGIILLIVILKMVGAF